MCKADSTRFTKRTRQTHRWLKTENTLTLFDDFNDSERLVAANECWAWVESFLRKIEDSVSLSIPTSDISRFNSSLPYSWTPVSQITNEMVELAKEVSVRTGGFYDPASCHLTDMWGFSPRTFAQDYTPRFAYDRPRLDDGSIPAPNPDDLTTAIRLCGPDGVTTERRQGKTGLIKTADDVLVAGEKMSYALDLGGIAKGWVCDAVLKTAKRCGFEYAAYSCESSMALARSASTLAMQRGDGRYTVSLARPRKKVGVRNYAQIWVRDRAVATSGDYGRCFEKDRIRYSHIINPRTGMPMNVSQENAFGGDGRQSGLCTVTLVGPDAARADALATAMCLMGREGAVNFYNDELAPDGWDFLAVEYDNARPGYLGLITSLLGDDLCLLDNLEVVSLVDAAGKVKLNS